MPLAPASPAGASATIPTFERPRPRRRATPFSTLKGRAMAAGLFERTRGFYVRHLIMGYAVIAASIWMAWAMGGIPGALLGGVVMAVGYVILAYVSHDAGHRQIFESPRANDVVGLAIMNLTVGHSFGCWVEKHNEHHNRPNQADYDPDIELPTIAFTRREARAKRGFKRFLVRHQAFLFFPTLSLLTTSMRLQGLRFLLRRPVTKRRVLELGLIGLHAVLQWGALIWLLGVPAAVTIIVLREALLSTTLGCTFAVNHKGMPVLTRKDRSSFLRRQIVTARNIRKSPTIAFVYGGLDSQIEHHLFPSMPRDRLPEARAVVQEFCLEEDIPYHVTGVLRSYVEVVGYLHRVSAPLR